MKLVKRLIPIMLSLILVLSMLPTGALAAATTDCSLSFKNSDGSASTAIYSAYKIVSFDGYSIPAGGTTYVYTGMNVDDAYVSTLRTALGLAAAATEDDILTALKNSGTNIGNVASALQSAATGTPANSTVSGANNTISGLGYGYYLVIEKTPATDDLGFVATKPILVCLPDTAGVKSVNINVKNSKADIVKKIVEGSALLDANTAAIGSTVNYQSVSSIPYYSKNDVGITYYISDKFSTGLTFDATPAKMVATIVNGAVTVATLVNGTDYTVTYPNSATETFRLTLNTTAASQLNNFLAWGAAGYSLKVTYSATVNSSAVVGGTTGNPNDITLIYGNTNKTYTRADHVTTFTTGIAINKQDDKTPAADLAGAVFKLTDSAGTALATYTYDAAGTSRVLASNGISTATGADGMTYFIGLNEGTYKIEETTAPAGYSLLPNPLTIVISATKDASGNATGAFTFSIDGVGYTGTKTHGNDILVPVTVTDKAGFTLPGTGGIGTTIFTVGGIAILLIGIFMVLVYTKKRKAENNR